jgi:purine-binding chemotaxis protein CheW
VAELTRNFLTFRVGLEWYGADIDSVIEVTYLVMLTELPATTPDMLGLITVRDDVMPVIDLRQRFGQADGVLKMDTPIICMHTANGPIGLVVDEAEDVIRVESAPVAGYEGRESRYVSGVLRLPDRLLLLLNGAQLRSEVHESDLPQEDAAEDAEPAESAEAVAAE